MKVVAITGPRECSLVERPDPVVRENYVRVKVAVAPMCTEFTAYRDGRASDSLGHEAMGEVVDVARPGRVRVGDRVVVMPQDGCGRCRVCLTGDHRSRIVLQNLRDFGKPESRRGDRSRSRILSTQFHLGSITDSSRWSAASWPRPSRSRRSRYV